MSTTRRWHLEHADGREWTRDELVEIVRDERRHDGLWPYDVNLFAVSVDGDGGCAYLLDNCMHWHALFEGDDMAVVWDR